MGCLASAAVWALAQDRAVTTAKSEEDRIAQVQAATVEAAEASEPIQFGPLAPGTVFQPYTVFADGADVTADAGEQLVYSNTKGVFVAVLGTNRLVADDIAITVPDRCKLKRYQFPVVGKFDPNGIGGGYAVTFALYSSCPRSVTTTEERAALIIQGTNTTVSFGDDAPRLITFIAGPNVPLWTDMWLGVSFDRGNAGVLVGTPPLQGFSCDQYDFPGLPCNSNLGGFPGQPDASFNLEIYADSACTPSFTGYKNNQPAGSIISFGQDVTFADDIQLVNDRCNLIGYEVAVKGGGFYTFDMRLNCEGPAITGTTKSFIVGPGTDLKIARFTVSPPVPLPQNLWFGAKVNNPNGVVVMAGQQACIGRTEDNIGVIGGDGVCVPTHFPGTGIHAALNLTITCAGPAPVGACCDMFLTECRGGPKAGSVCVGKCTNSPATRCKQDLECPTGGICAINIDCNFCSGGILNGLPCDPLIPAAQNPCNQNGGDCPVQGRGTCESVCRDVPQTNCAFPPRFSALQPNWRPISPTCSKGPDDGAPCQGHADCHGCLGTCSDDPNILCHVDADCAPTGGTCVAVTLGNECADDATCSTPDENGTCTSEVCVGGSRDGSPCFGGAGYCPGGGVCQGLCSGGLRDGVVCAEDLDCQGSVCSRCTRCHPDPFGTHSCGESTCCFADPSGQDDCDNLTLNSCKQAGDLARQRQWNLGKYCSDFQACPRIACLGRTGECTLPRCQDATGVCDTANHCVGGLNAGAVCTGNASLCRVCTNKTCTGNRVCSNKKCSGSPLNTACTGTGQGTCPANQTCNFINCTDNTPCTPVGGGTCPAAVSVCTGTGQGTCPANQTCSFITCTSDSVCTPVGNGTCPAGGVCAAPPNTCSAGYVGHPCRGHQDCDCIGGQCEVGSTCCDSCPPIGCQDTDCCTKVCNGHGASGTYCCTTEWDADCVSFASAPLAQGGCRIQPANDVCAPTDRLSGARLLIIDSGFATAETDSGRATEEPSDPGFGCYIPLPPDALGPKGLQTVWYKFFATQTSALLQTCGSNAPAEDSLLEVFAVGDPSDPQTQCQSLIPLGCSDDFPGCSDTNTNSAICVRDLIPGNLYYVLVAAKTAEDPGTKYRLDISTPCTCATGKCDPLANNDCPGAKVILDGTTAFGPDDLPKATLTAPIEACIPTETVDEWYRYTATCTGTLTVETCGSSAPTSPDTNLAVYSQGLCPPSSGGPIACSTDAGGTCGLGSKVEIDVVQGDSYTIRLADSAENAPQGNLKIACAQANCPAGTMTITSPPSGVVDAARPSDPNTAALQGIKTITATAPRAARTSCFSLCDTAFPVPANSIASVVEDPAGTYTITLTRPITPGALTTITYTDIHLAKSSGRFTSHPSNVDGDPIASPADVQHLVDILNGTGTPSWGVYSDDIDRSVQVTPPVTTGVTPADILEVVDLLNGAGPYDPWNGTPNQSANTACPPP
jgi:hypothetical protein